MCDMLITVELGQLGPILVLECRLISLLPDRSATDSLHVPLSLVPSSHHSLPRCSTPLFPLSSYKPRFLLCQIRIVHCQLWHFPRSLFIYCHPTSSPGLLVSPNYLVSYSTFFHDPHCTGFFVLLRDISYLVFTTCMFSSNPHLQGQFYCTFPPFRCLPLHFPTRKIRLRFTLGGMCDVYKGWI